MKTVVCLMVTLVAGGYPALARDQTESVNREFSYSRFVDPMTDSVSHLIATYAGSGGHLYWHCTGKLPLEVQFNWGKYFHGPVIVQYRTPPSPAAPARQWTLTSDRKSAMMPQREVSRFTSSALTNKKVVLEVRDTVDGETITHSFNLDGLDVAIQRLPCAVRFHKGGASPGARKP